MLAELMRVQPISLSHRTAEQNTTKRDERRATKRNEMRWQDTKTNKTTGCEAQDEQREQRYCKTSRLDWVIGAAALAPFGGVCAPHRGVGGEVQRLRPGLRWTSQLGPLDGVDSKLVDCLLCSGAALLVQGFVPWRLLSQYWR